MRAIEARNVLLLPGWQDSGPQHWQSHWQRQHGYTRVQQHDWQRPLRGDWSIQLEEAVLRCSGPALLVAHSLGCLLVAAWAAHSRNTRRVSAALLVAPADTEQGELCQWLPGWSPIMRQRLPFHAVLVASQNDPYCGFERARQLASDWGALLHDLGDCGHINADSGLGDWRAGQQWLAAWCEGRARPGRPDQFMD